MKYIPKTKHTIEECQKLAESRSGNCLSTSYKDTNTNLEWMCDKKHIWFASYHSVSRSSWCPECYKLNIMYTIDEMKEFAKKNNGECLSTEYINIESKLKWKCNVCGNVWNASPHAILSGTWCGICGYKKASKKKMGKSPIIGNIIEKIVKIVKENNGILMCNLENDYKSYKSKLKIKCNVCGRCFTSSYNILSCGSWCPYCSDSNSEKIFRKIMEHVFQCEFRKYRDANWLIGKNGCTMEIDGYNNDIKVAFEYQGAQHYKISNRMLNNVFKRYQEVDQYKAKKCEELGITLIIIPFKIKADEGQIFIVNEYRKLGGKLEINELPFNLDGNIMDIDKYNKIIDKAKINNGKCISKYYIDTNTKMKFICNQGHEWMARPQYVLQGTWCPICAKERTIKNLKSKN